MSKYISNSRLLWRKELTIMYFCFRYIDIFHQCYWAGRPSIFTFSGSAALYMLWDKEVAKKTFSPQYQIMGLLLCVNTFCLQYTYFSIGSQIICDDCVKSNKKIKLCIFETGHAIFELNIILELYCPVCNGCPNIAKLVSLGKTLFKPNEILKLYQWLHHFQLNDT